MEDFGLWIPVIIAGVTGIASAISAAFPDSKLGSIAGLVNALALNFGNAKNANESDE